MMHTVTSWFRSIHAGRFLFVAAVVMLFFAGFGLSRNWAVTINLSRTARGEHAGGGYVPPYRHQPGAQLVMAYVGSSDCPWSNESGLPDAVEQVKIRLLDYARENDMSFRAVGVALDWSAQRGTEHLAKFGLFDEISAGYNWGNTLAVRYLWSGDGVPHMTPLVLVYERTYIVPRDSTDQLLWGEAERRLIMFKAGAKEIMDWSREGTTFSPGVPGRE